MTKTVRIFRNGRDTGLTIDREKNLAYTASLENAPHIIESAFKSGIWSFYNGTKVPMQFSTPQLQLVKRRSAAIYANDDRKVAHLTNQLLDQHIVLEDTYEGDKLIETKGFYTVQATNPHGSGSLFAKEWQRGFDTGYYRSLRKNEAKHR